MGQHYALGHTGGAGGIKDIQGVCVCGCMGWKIRLVAICCFQILEVRVVRDAQSQPNGGCRIAAEEPANFIQIGPGTDKCFWF